MRTDGRIIGRKLKIGREEIGINDLGREVAPNEIFFFHRNNKLEPLFLIPTSVLMS